MKLLKNKLFVALLIAGIAVLGSFLLRWLPKKLDPSNLVIKIENGYTSQFCNIIYPQLSNCVTLPISDCPIVAKEQINICIKQNADKLQNASNKEEANKLYDGLGECFAKNMHDLILQKYLINTPECQQKLS